MLLSGLLSQPACAECEQGPQCRVGAPSCGFFGLHSLTAWSAFEPKLMQFQCRGQAQKATQITAPFVSKWPTWYLSQQSPVVCSWMSIVQHTPEGSPHHT